MVGLPRSGRLFSPSFFALALLWTGIGLVVGSWTIPVVGGLIGLGLAAFLLGVLAGGGRVLETALAGLVTSSLSFLFGHLLLAVFGAGVPLAVIGAGAGFVVGGLGAYLGGDLRKGLTRDV